MTTKNLSTGSLDNDIITMCANCRSVKFGNKWLSNQLAQLLIDIPKLKQMMCISHSICIECRIELYDEDLRNISWNNKIPN